jgi:putative membrane protein
MNYYGWGMMGPFFGGGWVLGAIFWIILGILFIFLVVKLISGAARDRSESENGNEERQETALQILKKRYAKGEITLKEFENMKKDIRD